MKGSLIGPEFNEKQIIAAAEKFNAKYDHHTSYEELTRLVAKKIDEGNVIGWFQGRMEYGPRALGARSILGDARNTDMQKKMNLKIKYREGFRPFAPSVLEEEMQKYFDIDRPSPYMLLVVPVKKERCNTVPDDYPEKTLLEKLYYKRSDIPAITHIDFTARIQTVNKDVHPRYWQLINEFRKLTGYGVIINTSFNVRGEPIVCTPEEAYLCFMRTEMDYLAMGNFLFEKTQQPEMKESIKWEVDLILD